MENAESSNVFEQALLDRMRNATATLQKSSRDASLGFTAPSNYYVAMGRARLNTEDVPQFMPATYRVFLESK